MSVLESLACATPVVSTDVGEVRRVVIPGKTGIVVPVNDAPALANAMTEMVDGQDRFRREACVEIASNYSAEKVLLPIYENYRRLTRQR